MSDATVRNLVLPATILDGKAVMFFVCRFGEGVDYIIRRSPN